MFLLGQTVGKYQILSNLGSGGFGTVFLAKDAWIDKKVAIKVPHRQGGDEVDLLQEPRLLAALDHQNIVGIVTAERVEGVFFIVMEYVKGESLESVLDREKSLDLPRAITFLEQVATLPWELRELDRVSPFSFGIYVSKIKETMTLEDPETTIERLYHEMYGRTAPTAAHADPA